MKTVGLTGGIGSGKTTVAQMFKDLGVPVYNSDDAGKRLMAQNNKVKTAIVKLLGAKAYTGQELNTKYIAEKVFNDAELLQKLNKIVHPAVKNDFNSWVKDQNTPYVIQEAAILFENGSYTFFDDMILVQAPKKIRIARVKERDNVSEKDILERMQHQWSYSKKKKLADYVILNNKLSDTVLQVNKVHDQLIKKYS
jgi:dephospho-CoA kinase